MHGFTLHFLKNIGRIPEEETNHLTFSYVVEK